MNKALDDAANERAVVAAGDAARPRRAGRRAGSSDTREEILAAARARFSTHGYGGTTIRAVAADAGVDAALVHYFFATKDGLFAAALELPVNPAEIVGGALEGNLDGLGERLVRSGLEAWDDMRTRATLLAVVRSATSHDAAGGMLRSLVEHGVVARLAAALPGPDARLRAALVGSQMAGLVVTRYVVRVEPLASADRETLVAAIGPTLQSYLTGPLADNA